LSIERSVEEKQPEARLAFLTYRAMKTLSAAALRATNPTPIARRSRDA